ncbi:KpsF/GutQ family sugar-phosphate isomerase [Achromobacter aloeverae]|uniref:D-arabinose 5-phosphate isomerase n=1 Tax=Achromobacter aloeverae TaxID=1750518 RepID=A0A4Q1HK12_9BURK|nr:KpsF/GutQ family sugar-phosphate isomerase [Achromobacter aloeverae]RXN90351.1 D-arabinose 5-phosphate isomerase [Achromobacter aloeverae]
MNALPATTPEATLASARRTLAIEAQALRDLEARLDDTFAQAVDMLLHCRGRIVVTGIGKTGHVASKVAATLASTGTPAFFMHAGEAAHGDLGMITAEDVMLAISYSGSGSELLTIVPVAGRIGARVIAMTGNPSSELARLADIHLDVSVAQEACPMNLAPTASTTTALAMGDALAVACLEARGFGPEDFARSHPGGALGRRLLTHVRDVMRQGDALPTVGPDATLSRALEEMSAKGMGMTVVIDENRHPIGIFTDGDLRRLIERRGDIRGLTIIEGMTRAPRTVRPDALAVVAAEQMDTLRLNQMLVLDENGALLGALHMHDLMAAKVV